MRALSMTSPLRSATIASPWLGEQQPSSPNHFLAPDCAHRCQAGTGWYLLHPMPASGAACYERFLTHLRDVTVHASPFVLPDSQGLGNSTGSGATGPEVVLDSEKLLWSAGD